MSESAQGKLMAVGQDQLTKDDYYTPRFVFDALGLEECVEALSRVGSVRLRSAA